MDLELGSDRPHIHRRPDRHLVGPRARVGRGQCLHADDDASTDLHVRTRRLRFLSERQQRGTEWQVKGRSTQSRVSWELFK